MQYIGTAIYTYAKESCYICGKNETLVDTGAYIEGEGELAVCQQCIKDMARTSDLVVEPAETIRGLEAQVEEFGRNLVASVDRETALKHRLEAVQSEWVAAVEAHEAAKRPSAGPRPPKDEA